MTAAWKGSRALFGKFFAPMMQGTISNSQISCHLDLRLPTFLHSLHRFQFEFLGKGPLLFRHDVFSSETLF